MPIADVYRTAAAYMMPEIAIAPCEIALLFGTRHGVDAFVVETLQLWRMGYFHQLIISGGTARGPGESEADVLAARLVHEGFPQERLILERCATNTPDNVRLSLEVLRQRGLETRTSVLGIGKICSLRRYYMTLAKYWPDATRLCVHGVNYFEATKSNWWHDDDFRQRVFGELTKIETYLRKGDLIEVNL